MSNQEYLIKGLSNIAYGFGLFIIGAMVADYVTATLKPDIYAPAAVVAQGLFTFMAMIKMGVGSRLIAIYDLPDDAKQKQLMSSEERIIANNMILFLIAGGIIVIGGVFAPQWGTPIAFAGAIVASVGGMTYWAIKQSRYEKRVKQTESSS